MDCRHNSRNQTSLNVRLYVDNDLTTMGKTENLSEQGMYIRTNSLLFPISSTLEVVYDNKEKAKEPQRVKAEVVHRSLEGIGVKFNKQ